MDDCIFCKIVNGELPAAKVYEDDRFLAFMDINPATRGHCLLIPKTHTKDVHTIDDDLLRELMVTGKKLAGPVIEGLGAKGINFIQSNGRAANQIIDHYHLHLLPRYSPEELPGLAAELVPGDQEDVAAAAEAIKKAL
jgi:histidine triad (HIT) family protein